MRAAVRTLFLFLAAGLATAAAGQKLPTGEYHTNRERTYDLIHYRAEIRFDFEQRRVHGRAVLTIEPLQALSTLVLDAILLEVESVTLGDDTLEHASHKKTLEITLSPPTSFAAWPEYLQQLDAALEQPLHR